MGVTGKRPTPGWQGTFVMYSALSHCGSLLFFFSYTNIFTWDWVDTLDMYSGFFILEISFGFPSVHEHLHNEEYAWP